MKLLFSARMFGIIVSETAHIDAASAVRTLMYGHGDVQPENICSSSIDLLEVSLHKLCSAQKLSQNLTLSFSIAGRGDRLLLSTAREGIRSGLP